MLSISSIEAKYRRAKLITKDTFLWAELDNTQKEMIEEQIDLNANERCVIYYHKSIGYSWIISNERLIILDAKTVLYYPYKIIKKVALPKIQDFQKGKSAIDKITIQLIDGKSISVFVENTTWHFIYELLKFLLPDKKV